MKYTVKTLISIIFLSLALGGCVANQTLDRLIFSKDGSFYLLEIFGEKPAFLVWGEKAAVSRDGKNLIYSSPGLTSIRSTYDKAILNIETGKKRGIRENLSQPFEFVWGPGGKRIILYGDFGFFARGPALYVIEADNPDSGRFEAAFTMPGGKGDFFEEMEEQARKGERLKVSAIFSPSWHPDGKSIFFHDGRDLVEINLEHKILSKTPLQIITGDRKRIPGKIIVSPISKDKILYEFKKSIYLYDRKSKERKRLTGGLKAEQPVWSVNGNQVYFVAAKDKQKTIYRIKTDGTGIIKIIDGENPSVGKASESE